MKLYAGSDVTVTSPGTKPGAAINAISAEVLLALGIDISAEQPKALTEDNMREAGLVVALGAEAKVPEVDGVRVETWETDEPGERGIEGRERMELVRADIHARVKELAARQLGETRR